MPLISALPRRHLVWSTLMLLIGLPALAGILVSANVWRIEATLRLRTGHIGVLEQSAQMCTVGPEKLPGVRAAKQALEQSALAKHVATAAQFEDWLKEGRSSALRHTPTATPEFCESFDNRLESENKFWQARADRWKSDATGF